MDTIIVTTNRSTIEWLKMKGITGRVIPHPTPKDVRGCIVYGVLPSLHLAALAAEVWVVTIPNLPREKRGQKLSIEEMDAYGAHRIQSIPNLGITK